MLLPFDRVTVETVSPPRDEPATARYEPSDEALAAFERLEERLTDTLGRPLTLTGEQTLNALAQSLLEGKKGWHQAAEDLVQALQACPTIGGIEAAEERAFHEVIEDLLDCLDEAMLNSRQGQRRID